MTTATFSGGPWAGEMRELPGSGPPPVSLDVAIAPPLSAVFVASPDDVGPDTAITPEIFTYVRHGYDTHTMLWVYVPKQEMRIRHPDWGITKPHIKHWMCRECDVRWYGTRACWICGQETGE